MRYSSRRNSSLPRRLLENEEAKFRHADKMPVVRKERGDGVMPGVVIMLEIRESESTRGCLGMSMVCFQDLWEESEKTKNEM